MPQIAKTLPGTRRVRRRTRVAPTDPERRVDAEPIASGTVEPDRVLVADTPMATKAKAQSGSTDPGQSLVKLRSI